jgi:hypothetical protein
MIIKNPELLGAVRAHFPTAESVEVHGKSVYVRCGEQPDWSGWGRRVRPSTVTSPATAVLAAKAVALASEA